MHYDSEDEEEDEENPLMEPIKAIFDGLAGESITLKMSPTGKILDVKGVEELFKKMQGDGEDDPMGGAFRQAFDEKALKRMWQQSFTQLPDKPVEEGDKWKDETVFGIPSMGDLKLKTESELRDLRDGGDRAIIWSELKMSMEEAEGDEEDEEDQNPFGGMFQIDDAKGTTQTEWLVKEGRLDTMKTEMEMTLAVGDQEFVMEMKTKMEFKKGDIPSGDEPKKEEKKDKKKDDKSWGDY
jgi:hypothetical protein